MKIRNLFLAVLFFGACKNNKDVQSSDPSKVFYKEENSKEFKESVTLKEAGTVSFPLDSMIPLTATSLEVFFDKNKGKNYFTLLNEYNGDIYVYDYESKQIVNKIHLSSQGPNAVGHPPYLSFHAVSMDSIIVCNNWDTRVFLVDSRGSILKKVQLPIPTGGSLPVAGPSPSTENPMTLYNGTVYIPSRLIDLLIKDNTKLKTLITVDLSSGVTKRIFPRPELFNTGTWSGYQYNMYSTFNTKTGNFVCSFSGDPFLYTVDTTGKVLSKDYLGSKFFNEVNPFSFEKLTAAGVDANFSKIEAYDFTNARFGKLIYDQYNDVYYRMTTLGMTPEEHKNPNTRSNPRESIIICDKNFKKIGEVELPFKTYNTKMFFITKEGLNMSLVPELQKNEDNLSFTTFKLESK